MGDFFLAPTLLPTLFFFAPTIQIRIVRDSIREYPSTGEVLVVLWFVVFLVLLFSEVLVFVTYSLPLVSGLLVLLVSIEGTLAPIGYALPSTCTVLLSNSGLSLLLVFLGRVGIVLLFADGGPVIPGLASTFQSLQIKEFRGITLYMNESTYSCVSSYLRFCIYSMLYWACWFWSTNLTARVTLDLLELESHPIPTEYGYTTCYRPCN